VVYRDAAREIVAAWKERGLRRLAAPAAAIVASVVPRPKADAVTFVPPDGERSAKRGHHPAERLAEELATCWELPLPAEPLLGRARRAEQRQRGLTLAARRRNVRGAFRPLARAPPAVVLVDDVYTSGATVNAAASALRRAGARRVEVVTFARAVRYIG
jgi:predicted amidophosphoribosyltransferase